MTEPLDRHSPFVQGPSGVRTAILEYMELAIPNAIASAKREWEPDAVLPAPQLYLPYEPQGISHRTGPIFGVGVVGTSVSNPVDFTGALELEVMTRFSVRLYLWVYTPETEDGKVLDDAREATVKVRDDLSTLIRSVLFAQPGLNHPDVYSIQTRTVREDFSDATHTGNNSGRYIAAVAISFDMDVEERLDMPVMGYVSTDGDGNPGVDVQANQLGDTHEQ